MLNSKEIVILHSLPFFSSRTVDSLFFMVEFIVLLLIIPSCLEEEIIVISPFVLLGERRNFMRYQ